MKDSPTCRNCGHVKSLHWRPACNAVGCPCREFATRPAEDDCDHGRAAHTDKGCSHCDCRRTYDGSLATRPAEDAEDRGTVNGEHRSAHE